MKENLSKEEAQEERQRLVEHIDECDAQVSPHTPGFDLVANINQKPELEPFVSGAKDEPEPVSPVSSSTKAKDDFATTAQHFLFTKGKWISLMLSICIALVTGFVIHNDRTATEKLFRKYMSEAELLEYDKQYASAIAAWHHAINLATQLGDKPRLVADLYVRAAANTDFIKTKDAPNNKLEAEAANVEWISKMRALQIKDLRTALSLYERIPNTTAEQIRTADSLIYLIKAATEPTVPSHLSKETLNYLELANKELKGKSSTAKALYHYREYLHNAKDSSGINTQAIAYAKSLQPYQDVVAREITINKYAIPLFHEIIYYSRGDSNKLLELHQWLDWLYKISDKDPLKLNGRLLVADQAYANHDYHGAVVEYVRCLGIKPDQVVRDKLIKSLQMCRAAEAGKTDVLPDYIALLIKERNLKQKAFAKDRNEVNYYNILLSKAYLLASQFENGELLLKPLAPDTSHGEQAWHIPFALADLYAKEGKLEEAVAMYHVGQEYEQQDEFFRNHPEERIWKSIGDAYISAGRYVDAKEAIKHYPPPPVAGDSFSSGASSPALAPFIE